MFAFFRGWFQLWPEPPALITSNLYSLLDPELKRIFLSFCTGRNGALVRAAILVSGNGENRRNGLSSIAATLLASLQFPSVQNQREDCETPQHTVVKISSSLGLWQFWMETLGYSSAGHCTGQPYLCWYFSSCLRPSKIIKHCPWDLSLGVFLTLNLCVS